MVQGRLSRHRDFLPVIPRIGKFDPLSTGAFGGCYRRRWSCDSIESLSDSGRLGRGGWVRRLRKLPKMEW